MKRKFLTALVIAGGLFLTACQEDPAMDELIEDTEQLSQQASGDDDDDDGGNPAGNN